jgi:hypothetical protein
MDLSIKPADEIPIKSSEDMKEELIKNSEETENKDADKIKNIPLKTDMSDIFDTASKKSMEKIQKQREKLNKQQARLRVREEREKLKQQKAEMKAQKEKLKLMSQKTRKPRKKTEPKAIPKQDPFKDMRGTKRVEKKKRVKYVEVSETESSEEEIVYVKKKKKTKKKPTASGIAKAPPKSRIQQLTPDELTQLYGVFKQADEANKKKKPPKPKINYYNPIESNPFTHLNNPFNF